MGLLHIIKKITRNPQPVATIINNIIIYLWRLVSFIVLFTCTTSLYAEGTKTWSTSATDYSFLKVNTGGFYAFAGYGLAANKRLHIHINDPENEMVYIGLSRFVDENSIAELSTAYQFRIKSPSGTVVHGPYAVSSPNLTSYSMAAAGPQDIVGSSGYSTANAMWKFDPSGKGLPSGDYYIEFDRVGSIRWFDITVATTGAFPTAIDGRVWSQAWAVRANDGFGDGQYFDEPFNGLLVAYDGKYATSINFDGSGLRPLEGQFSFNQTGTGNTGNKENDRKSVNGVNATNPFHKIFLNTPDPAVYPLQAEGTLQNLPLKVSDPANPTIGVEVTQPGKVELLLDFGGGGNDRRLFADVVAGLNQIPWDGKDGSGVDITPSDYPIPVNISYTQGETHFTAYDVEGLDNGFQVFTLTTGGAIGPRLQFWDDVNIADNPGFADAQTNVDTGATTRRRWNNMNYGDVNTINTWWFAYRDAQSTTILLPGDYGDAPATYGNAVHKVVTTPTVYLGGTAPDKEDTAVSPLDATGDNADNVDDEDAFTSLPTLLATDTSYALTVPCAGTGTVAGWIDFDQSGTFEASERSSAACSGGNAPLSWSSLSGLSIGTTYVRLRIASNAVDVNSPKGGASDGEVEDYALTISGYDYGDAPSDLTAVDASLSNIYHVLKADNAAEHLIDLTKYMGASIDNEADGQPSVNADGDGASDDGVTFPTASDGKSILYMDEANDITVNVSADGVLSVWFDWNEDGDWDDAGEQIANDLVVTTGDNTVTVTTTNLIPQGSKYARFRYCSTAGQCNTPSGLASDGEVEDYKVDYLAYRDMGNQCNVLVNGSFELPVTPGTWFIDENSVPGWATRPDSPAELTFAERNTIELQTGNKSFFNYANPVKGSQFAEINAHVSGTLYQDIALAEGTTVEWSFWHRGRSGSDSMNVLMGTPDEVASLLPSTVQGIQTSPNTEWRFFSGTYVVPAGQPVTRFGFHSVSTATGSNGNGNLIDNISLGITCRDYGDAPDSYHTLNSNNGAYHKLVDTPLIYIGGIADKELDGNPNAAANGDDLSNTDDEEGVVSFPILQHKDNQYSIDVNVTNNAGRAANLVGWVDFNNNGQFETSEAATVAVADGSNNTTVSLKWTGLSGLQVGNTYVRLRLTTDITVATGVANTSVPDGIAADGEIEDYLLPIAESPLDYGDAPASFSDASHYLPQAGNVYLGSVQPDAETGTLLGADNGLSATGDNVDGSDDEESVTTFPELNDLDTTYSLSVVVNNPSTQSANLMGWIDVDGNGLFDEDEASTVSVVAAGASNANVTLNWSALPADIAVGDSYVRLRITTDTIAGTDAADVKNDGEVEDYALPIVVGGYPVRGRVYNDADVNGVNNSNESGISDLPIVLLDVANNTCISTRTDAEGNYTFFPVIPGDYRLYEASRETVPTPQNCDITQAKDPAGYRSTTENILPQFSVTDTEITGKNFGDVKTPLFSPDHSGTVLADNIVLYSHKFTARSTGSIIFSSSNSSLLTSGWTSIIYKDNDCNGQINANDLPVDSLASPLATSAGQVICILNKVYAPADVREGETYSNVISAKFIFNNNTLAGTSTLKVTDLSKAAASDSEQGSSRLKLVKKVENITQGTGITETQNTARPGDVLTYYIHYANTGTSSITDLKINDVIPEFTTLTDTPTCQLPLPASLTTCSGNVSGSNIEWIFGVNDVLEGGARGVVSYQVIIDH